MAIRAGLYARISLDWEGKGLGVERQLQDCRELEVLRATRTGASVKEIAR